MLSCTVSQGKLASSWNTTPTPSTTPPPIGRPSNSTSPRVGRASPASNSSKVDFPQPDGPTTEKNSPLRNCRSIGPTAWTGPPAAAGRSKILSTPERVT
jgi:hypothetical protein